MLVGGNSRDIRERRCSVPQCLVGRKDEVGDLILHGFPKANKHRVKVIGTTGASLICRRQAWLIILGLKESSITKAFKVCSNHFVKSDYIPVFSNSRSRRLKNTAVPSRNLPIQGQDQGREHVKTACTRGSHDRRSLSTIKTTIMKETHDGSDNVLYDIITVYTDDMQFETQNQETSAVKTDHHKTLERLDPLGVDMYSCSKCSHKTSSAHQLDYHIQTKHNCNYATEPFHATIKPEQFSCVFCFCDYNSYYLLELYEHYKQVHVRNEHHEVAFFSKKKIKKVCAYCKNESYSSLSLIKHQALCEKVPRTVLHQDSTGETDNMESIYLDHPYAKTSEILIRRFKCDHCSYRARFKSRLKYHMLQHATDKEITWFNCSSCSYRCKSKVNLERHMLLHV